MITSLKDCTAEQLEYFAKYRQNSLFSVTFSEDNTIVSKQKYKITGAETGAPVVIDDGIETIAMISNRDYQSEIDDCQKRIDIIRQFMVDEGLNSGE